MAFVEDTVALVTGGAGGIGYAIAENLLKNGAKGVAIADISEEGGNHALSTLTNTFGDKVIFIKTDVSNAAEFQAAFTRTIETFSQLDIVVNNAGICNEVDWERTIRINLEGVMRGSFLAMDYLPKYRSKSDAAIVNIASLLGIEALGSAPAYVAAKHGIVGFGKSISIESRHNEGHVRIITICPNAVQTSMSPTSASVVVVKDIQRVFDEISTLFKVPCSADFIGKNVVDIISNGANGSVWILENEADVYEVELPPKAKLLAKSS